MGLNKILPPDVAVIECEAVAADWNPRRGATGKHYRYTLLNRSGRSPLHERRTWWQRGALDLDAMAQAGAHLLGEHDFSSFRSSHCTSRTPFRRMDSIEVARQGDLIHVDVRGSAFLQHMVRILAGTLVDVGRGRRRPDELPELLASRDRTRAGRTAPAKGLTLVSVHYDGERAGEADGWPDEVDAGPARFDFPRSLLA